MRYRGEGVGHKYMRDIESWLWETGWGWDIGHKTEEIPETKAMEDEPDSDEEGNEEEEVGDEENKDEEVESEDEGEGDGNESEEENEDEIIEDEETMEGELGYSIF